MHRRVDKLHLMRQAPSDLGSEGFVEGRRRVRREVVQHYPDALGPWVVLLYQMAHLLGELPTTPALGRGHPTPAGKRLEGHRDVGGAPSLVLVVATSTGQSHSGGQWLADLGKELAGTLIETDHGDERIVRVFVEVEYGLHPPDERGVLFRRDHPPFEEVGTQFVFLSVFLTVSWVTASTIP